MADLCGWCARRHTGGPEYCLTGVVIVCGGRDFSDERVVFDGLDVIAMRVEITGIRHGACGLDRDKIKGPISAYLDKMKGADRLADQWALARRHPVQRFPASWSRRGRAAGPRRNTSMLRHHEPGIGSSCAVLVVAFPGGQGTADMIRQAQEAMTPVAHFNTTDDGRRYLTIRWPVREDDSHDPG